MSMILHSILKKEYDDTEFISRRSLLDVFTKEDICDILSKEGIDFPNVTRSIVDKSLVEIRDIGLVEANILRGRNTLFKIDDILKIAEYIAKRQNVVKKVPPPSRVTRKNNINNILKDITSENLAKNKHISKQIALAKVGDEKAQKYLMDTLKCKVYSKEEIKEYLKKKNKSPK